MQRAVSDSDVIIHLAKLNELNLIKELYECAHIPRYVELEMVRCQYDEVGIIEEAVRHGVLKVYETDDSKARSIAERHGIHIVLSIDILQSRHACRGRCFIVTNVQKSEEEGLVLQCLIGHYS